MGFFDRLFKGKEVFADRRNPDMGMRDDALRTVAHLVRV